MSGIKFLFFIGILITFSSANAQKVVVLEGEERIDNLSRKGLMVFLDLDMDFVQSGWQKKLKEFGKYVKKSGAYFVEEATFQTISSTPIKAISKLEQTTKGVKLWLGVDKGTEFVTSSGDKKHFDEVVKILHDFGVQMYLADINNQLKDAEKVLMNAVKEQEKVVNKGISIKENMNENRRDSVRLQMKLTENSLQYKQLRADSVSNYQSQKAAAENVDKMRRAVELVRAKLNTVE